MSPEFVERASWNRWVFKYSQKGTQRNEMACLILSWQQQEGKDIIPRVGNKRNKISHVKEREIPFSEYFGVCFRLKGNRSSGLKAEMAERDTFSILCFFNSIASISYPLPIKTSIFQYNRFISIWFIYPIIHPLDVYNSLFFSVFRVVQPSILEHFCHPDYPLSVSPDQDNH